MVEGPRRIKNNVGESVDSKTAALFGAQVSSALPQKHYKVVLGSGHPTNKIFVPVNKLYRIDVVHSCKDGFDLFGKIDATQVDRTILRNVQMQIFETVMPRVAWDQLGQVCGGAMRA